MSQPESLNLSAVDLIQRMRDRIRRFEDNLLAQAISAKEFRTFAFRNSRDAALLDKLRRKRLLHDPLQPHAFEQCPICLALELSDAIVTVTQPYGEEGETISRYCESCARTEFDMVPCEGCATWLDGDTCIYDVEGNPLCDPCAKGCEVHDE